MIVALARAKLSSSSLARIPASSVGSWRASPTNTMLCSVSPLWRGHIVNDLWDSSTAKIPAIPNASMILCTLCDVENSDMKRKCIFFVSLRGKNY